MAPAGVQDSLSLGWLVRIWALLCILSVNLRIYADNVILTAHLPIMVLSSKAGGAEL